VIGGRLLLTRRRDGGRREGRRTFRLGFPPTEFRRLSFGSRRGDRLVVPVGGGVMCRLDVDQWVETI